MTCLKSADPPTNSPQKSGSIVTQPPRTFGYIYKNLVKGKDYWIMPMMFLVGMVALARMFVNGIRLYVLR